MQQTHEKEIFHSFMSLLRRKLQIQQTQLSLYICKQTLGGRNGSEGFPGDRVAMRCCQWRGHGFSPWSKEDHAMEQLGPCPTTAETEL